MSLTLQAHFSSQCGTALSRASMGQLPLRMPMEWAERSSPCSSFQTSSLFAASLGCTGRVREKPFSNCQVKTVLQSAIKTVLQTVLQTAGPRAGQAAGPPTTPVCLLVYFLPMSPFLAHLPMSSFLVHFPIGCLPIFCPFLPIFASQGPFDPPSAAPGTAPFSPGSLLDPVAPGLSPGWGTSGTAQSNPHPHTYLTHPLRLSLLFVPLCSGAKRAPTLPARWG